jgi:hypothetical protein
VDVSQNCSDEAGILSAKSVTAALWDTYIWCRKMADEPDAFDAEIGALLTELLSYMSRSVALAFHCTLFSL